MSVKPAILALSLCSLFQAQSANAITRPSFEAFYGPVTTLYHYDDDGTSYASIFGFAADGLHQAARLVPMNNAHYPEEYYMYFYDIVGDDLFGRITPETIYIRASDITSCPAVYFSLSPSFTDLMNRQISARQIDLLFNARFHENLNSGTAYSSFESIQPVLYQTITQIEDSYGVSLRLNTDLPNGLNSRYTCGAQTRPQTLDF